MGLFDGKKGLILGVANEDSIAWAIASTIMNEGGVCGFSHLPDKPDDERKKSYGRVAKCIDKHPHKDRAKFLMPVDVQKDADIAAFMAKGKEEFGTIDFLLHSVAFASLDDLKKDTIDTSREGFKMAMEISAYSLLAVCSASKDILKPAVLDEKKNVVEHGGAVLTMTYFGGEKCVPGYNVMGICKAALDASVKYAAFDLGIKGIRVNAISAGPLKTLASSAVGAKGMIALYDQVSPMARNISHEEVGRTGAYLLSDWSDGISGEIVHVDAGYHMMGSPGRLLDKLEGK